MKRRRWVKSFAVCAAVMVTAGGCAATPANKPASTQPLDQQALDDLQPPIALPTPATQPDDDAPPQALQLYAQGRDALLKNDKQKAAEKFSAVLAIDPMSGVTQRDLGYASLGVDNDRALVAFQQALKIDPTDGDSRLQEARLLIDAKRFDEALQELRLIRLTQDYEDYSDLAALTDLLLGRLLENRQYRLAALQCYENVLKVLDAGDINLRGRPELAELVAKPAALVLRTADLALICGQHDYAIGLYERIEKQEPQAVAVLELRIARADLAAGREQDAAERAFGIVDRFQASRSVVRAFADLFTDAGGLTEALNQSNKITATPQQQNTLHSLRAQLFLANNDASSAIKEIDHVDALDLTSVRTTVHAYRSADRYDDLLRKLIERTAAQPQRWPVISHAWTMLTQMGQSDPLRPSRLDALQVPKQFTAAKQFVLSQLYSDSGQPLAARRLLQSATKADADFVKSIAARGASDNVNPDLDFATSTDLSSLLIDLSDDPELLSTSVAAMLRDGQKQIVQESLQLANSQKPANVVIASVYAQVLAADQQNTEAVAVLDRASTTAGSASELYYLSSQFSAMGDNKSSEQILRKAYDKDPESAAVCNDLGFMLADEGRDLDYAEKLLWRACGIEPDNPAYLDSLGWLLYKRMNYGQAVQYLQQALGASDPVDAAVLDHTGDAAYRNKQNDRARSYWLQAIGIVRQRGASDPQLRLRLEQKVRQLDAKQNVDVAPIAK